ncbi:MAG TPA: SDR family oxidoreductase [Polyangiaceae bacterium]|jgi:NAD(P)-dependent dehydrogenase (short-subunit alcohol dehydrogenase family)
MLITGGGRGIGAATARLAAAGGYAVAVNFVKDEKAAHGVVSEIRASGGAAVAICADVSQEADVERLFREAVGELGPLTVLVNNAGIVDRTARVDEIRVNAVRPGIIDTEIHAGSGDPARAQRLAPELPLHRPGAAREVANAILWLVSDEASYCTGSILDVAGGR